MMATKRERRRNQFPGTCRVCSAAVEAGAGWLYSDTGESGRRQMRRRQSNRWPKFVKCDRCHTLKAVRSSDLPKNRPAPQPKPPTLGVDAIRAAHFEPGYTTESRFGGLQTSPVVFLVLADDSREVALARRPITWEPVSCWTGDGWSDGLPSFAGRTLTRAAEKEITRVCDLALDIFEAFFDDPWAMQDAGVA